MKKSIVLVSVWVLLFAIGSGYAADDDYYSITGELGIRAVINTKEKGPVDAVWKKGGDQFTERGDRVVWGHFYASPSDVNWGSRENPDAFVKIWFDVTGRIDVNFFHVSVPVIDVYSAYSYGDAGDRQGTITMDDRYTRHEYQGPPYEEPAHDLPYILKEGCVFTLYTAYGTSEITSSDTPGAFHREYLKLNDIEVLIQNCEVVENETNVPVYEE